MEEKRCLRCERSESETRLVRAVDGTDVVDVCERCSIIDGLPVIRSASTDQLKAAEKTFDSVHERMRRMAGLKKEEKKQETILEQLKRLENETKLKEPERKPLNLIDNFHWHVTRARRKKGLSTGRLAQNLGESEAAVKMAERGILPHDAENLIKKLEQFFNISLRNKTPEEIREEQEILERTKEKFRARLRVEEAEKATRIRAPDREYMDLSKKTRKEEKADDTDVISGIASGKIVELGLKPEETKRLTIFELRRMKQEKEKAERARLEEAREQEKREQEEREKQERQIQQEAEGEAGEGEGEKATPEEKGIIRRILDATKKSRQEAILKTRSGGVPTISELAEKKKQKEQGRQESYGVEVEEDEE